MNSIEVKGVSKKYPKFQMEDISFALPQGCIMGLIGENGAGKSTLMRIIMNATPKDTGKVSVLGVDNEDTNFFDVKQDVGVVLDEANLPGVLKTKEIGKIMAGTYKNWQQQEFERYLEKFSIPSDVPFEAMSRGMKMKLLISTALSHKAKLLVLDEATSGLDPIARDEMLDVLNDFTRNEENSVLLSSHITSDLEKICDYIAFVHQGKLVLWGEKDRIMEEYAVIKTTKEDFEAIRKDAIVSANVSRYGVEALVRRNLVPGSFSFEHTNLEDIILFLAKRG